MGDVNNVCVELANVVGLIAGLRAKHFNDDTVQPPEAHVTTRDFEPRYVFDGTTMPLHLTVRVMVPRTPARQSQERLREFMDPSGPLSVQATIEDEQNWPDNFVQAAEVVQITEPYQVQLGSPGDNAPVFLAADWWVDLIL